MVDTDATDCETDSPKELIELDEWLSERLEVCRLKSQGKSRKSYQIEMCVLGDVRKRVRGMITRVVLESLGNSRSQDKE